MNAPFLLSPAAKDYLWGGNRLNDEFAKNINISPLAETWECSTHPDGLSYVKNCVDGSFTDGFSKDVLKDISLKDILHKHPEYLGSKHFSKQSGTPNTADGENVYDLPILVKFIDASKDLSVQVHPTDEYAKEHENGQLGKTEMWYVLDATKDAYLIYGLAHDTSKEVLRKAIETGELEKHLQKVPIHPGDVFMIEAGTIHAICAGALVAEIQENSNLTYRLYDYNRVDKNGHTRELHIDKALEVANLKAASSPRQPIRVLQYKPGVATELLTRCKYFEVHHMIVNTERRQQVFYQTDESSFRVLLCVNGCGTIEWGNNSLNIYKGDCIFVPASSEKIKINGQVNFLDIRG